MNGIFLKNKKFILIILFILALISIVWIYLKSKGQGVTSLPTPIPRIFQLSGIAPKNGVDATIIPTTAIEFMFNKSIDPDTLVVTIDPETEFSFEVAENRRSFFVRPIPSWTIDQNYMIKIIIESDEGEKIPEIEYPLRLKKIIESDFNEVF